MNKTNKNIKSAYHNPFYLLLLLGFFLDRCISRYAIDCSVAGMVLVAGCSSKPAVFLKQFICLLRECFYSNSSLLVYSDRFSPWSRPMTTSLFWSEDYYFWSVPVATCSEDSMGCCNCLFDDILSHFVSRNMTYFLPVFINSFRLSCCFYISFLVRTISNLSGDSKSTMPNS